MGERGTGVRRSGRRATPARPQQRHDALAARVRRLVEDACKNGDLAALDAALAPVSPFAQGRLVELWLQAALLGLLVQLGVLPPLDLAQALAMAQVARAGALLAGEPVPCVPPLGC